jgi:hypothetical protein
VTAVRIRHEVFQKWKGDENVTYYKKDLKTSEIEECTEYEVRKVLRTGNVKSIDNSLNLIRNGHPFYIRGFEYGSFLDQRR